MRADKQGSRASRSVWRGAIAIAVLALLPAAPALSAANDVGVARIEASMGFVLGSPVEFSSLHCNNVPDSCCGDYFDARAVLEVEFGGLGPSGTWLAYNGNRGHSVASGAEGNQGAIETGFAYAHLVTNYDGTCGGGSLVLGSWHVEATSGGDPEITTGAYVDAGLLVYDENGRDLAHNRPDSDVVEKGRWWTASCDCWVGGTVRWTRERGAKLRHTAEVQDGDVIAVVMPMAPNRGEARVKLDGVNQGRIDTYAPTSENRIVMWQTPPLDAGVHTVTIVNLATEGRPRIDVDAFLTDVGNTSFSTREVVR